MKKYILLLLIAGNFSLIAQNQPPNNDVKLAALPIYNFGRGVGLTSPDSLFQFNIRFRMQNRATFYSNEEQYIDAQIRRLRLRFDGFVGDPRFLYVIQLSFSPQDHGPIEAGGNVNIIRDAVFFYRPNSRWNIGFGQTKIPGNRQRINSSSALQLTDRSINNCRFNVDRDFGVHIYHLHEYKDRFGYNIKTSITTGEGRNFTDKEDLGLAYTAKGEIFPFGAFTNNGAYFEGDLMREKTPKLMLSAAYQINDGAIQAQGQRGGELFQAKDMHYLFLDGVLKYKGWALQSAYMQRYTDGSPIAFDLLDTTGVGFNYALTGRGYDTQLSYIFKNNIELIGRYSYSLPGKMIQDIVGEINQYTFGVSKYIKEHAFKLQAEITKETVEFLNQADRNNWYGRIQVEIGI
jgi:phosphate-selective porin OprO and OprP